MKIHDLNRLGPISMEVDGLVVDCYRCLEETCCKDGDNPCKIVNAHHQRGRLQAVTLIPAHLTPEGLEGVQKYHLQCTTLRMNGIASKISSPEARCGMS